MNTIKNCISSNTWKWIGGTIGMVGVLGWVPGILSLVNQTWMQQSTTFLHISQLLSAIPPIAYTVTTTVGTSFFVGGSGLCIAHFILRPGKIKTSVVNNNNTPSASESNKTKQKIGQRKNINTYPLNLPQSNTPELPEPVSVNRNNSHPENQNKVNPEINKGNSNEVSHDSRLNQPPPNTSELPEPVSVNRNNSHPENQNKVNPEINKENSNEVSHDSPLNLPQSNTSELTEPPLYSKTEIRDRMNNNSSLFVKPINQDAFQILENDEADAIMIYKDENGAFTSSKDSHTKQSMKENQERIQKKNESNAPKSSWWNLGQYVPRTGLNVNFW